MLLLVWLSGRTDGSMVFLPSEFLLGGGIHQSSKVQGCQQVFPPSSLPAFLLNTLRGLTYYVFNLPSLLFEFVVDQGWMS